MRPHILDERDDEVDDLVEGVRRRVDVHGAVGHRERGRRPARVDLVAGQQGLLGGRDVGAALLGGAAGGAGGGVGADVELDRGVRDDDRADVAALDDDPAAADSSAITARWSSRRRARTSGTALTGETAALTSSLRIPTATSTPSTVIVGSSGSVPETMSGSPHRAATAAGSWTSTPARSSHQVIARNIAPVSR